MIGIENADTGVALAWTFTENGTILRWHTSGITVAHSAWPVL